MPSRLANRRLIMRRRIPIVTGGAASMSFIGSDGNGNNATTRNFTFALGAAATGDLVVVGVVSQNNDPTTVVLDSGGSAVAMTLVTSNLATGVFSGLYRATVPGGLASLNVQVNGAAVFNEVGVSVRLFKNLLSNTEKQKVSSATGGGSATINVAAGDFLVSECYLSATVDYVGSDGTPTVRTNSGTVVEKSAEWTIGAGNAAFNIVPHTGLTSASASFA